MHAMRVRAEQYCGRAPLSKPFFHAWLSAPDPLSGVNSPLENCMHFCDMLAQTQKGGPGHGGVFQT